MLLIDKDKKKLSIVERQTMKEAGYWERRDIQEMICSSPESFCEELGEYIYLVGAEVQPAEFVQDRIDILGVDPDGIAVVIEIKRDSSKLQLLQALTYSALISKWEPKGFVESLIKFNKRYADPAEQTLEEVTEELNDILDEGDFTAINRRQRIVLLAEEFDYVVLSTAEWLTEQYDVDIRCYRLRLARHGDDHFLTCSREYPPPELTEIAIRRRRSKATGVQEPTINWDEALKTIDNPVERNFLAAEVANGVDNVPSRRMLSYKDNRRLRYRLWAKRPYATVEQNGRFDQDESFWKSRLSENAFIRTRNKGNELRFRLFTEEDFKIFRTAKDTELKNIEFSKNSANLEMIEEDESGED